MLPRLVGLCRIKRKHPKPPLVKIRYRACIAAGLFARAARIGTNATMFMMRRMPHAFITTAAAHFCAETEHRPGDGSVGACRARSKKSSRTAHIRAVQIHADTLAQFSDRFFTETRIGAGDAHLSAIEASFRSTHGKLIGIAVNPGMGF
jgi:hypothetical protein